MFGLFKKRSLACLTVKVNGKEICSVSPAELPIEKSPSLEITAGSHIEFLDSNGIIIRHDLAHHNGWFHFSIRVQKNFACQIDCIITKVKEFEKDAFQKGDAIGIRFQPFFIAGADISNDIFNGRGLFKRGLHYSGTVTNGAIKLSCICDRCKKSFFIKSFHSGFSNLGYFYSASGSYTIAVSDQYPGAPAALSTPQANELTALEAKLPLAPDKTSYSYLNPFRCPHCKEPYIDFVKYPEERMVEYYGNYFDGATILQFDPN